MRIAAEGVPGVKRVECHLEIPGVIPAQQSAFGRKTRADLSGVSDDCDRDCHVQAGGRGIDECQSDQRGKRTPDSILLKLSTTPQQFRNPYRISEYAPVLAFAAVLHIRYPDGTLVQ